MLFLPVLQLVIDVSGFYDFFDKPVPEMYWAVFKYGGWIPIVYLLWKLAVHKWLESRQEKYAHNIRYVLLNINIPRMNEQSPRAVEHIFTHVAGTYSAPIWKEKWFDGKFTPPMSFEYASINGYTQFLVRAAVPYRDLIEASIFSQYPDAEINEIADYTQAVPHSYPDPEWDCWGTEFILGKPSAYPIRTYAEFEHELSQELKDPLSTLLETLSRLKAGEQVWLQILIFPGDTSWQAASAAVIAKLRGKEVKKKPSLAASIMNGFVDFFLGMLSAAFSSGEEKKPEKKEENKLANLSSGEKKVLEAVELKASKISFRTKFRFVYVGKKPVFRKGPMISMVRGAIGLFSAYNGNSFKNDGRAAPKTDYFWQRWSANAKKNRIIRRYAGRSGDGATPFILNTEELASLWHFPAIQVKAPLIKKVESRKVEPPFSLPEVPEVPSGAPDAS